METRSISLLDLIRFVTPRISSTLKSLNHDKKNPYDEALIIVRCITQISHAAFDAMKTLSYSKKKIELFGAYFEFT